MRNIEMIIMKSILHKITTQEQQNQEGRDIGLHGNRTPARHLGCDVGHGIRIQRGENHRRSGVCGSCTYVREHTAEDKCIELYGIPEREEHADDL